MSLPSNDWDHIRSSIDRGAERLAALLRSAPDRQARVTGLDWSVAELGQHFVTEAARFESFGRGDPLQIPPEGVAQVNAEANATVGEDDPVKLADLFAGAHRSYAALAATKKGDDPYIWYGMNTTWAGAAAIYLGELNVHGVDLSRTLGKRWKIERADALEIAYGLIPVLPTFVDPQGAKGFKGSFELRLRGGGSAHLAFDDATLVVSSPDGRKADCNISADPEAFLLVGYGRASQWGPIMKGKIFASGRKPWLGFKFNSLLAKP